jgi:hypothetical protein
MAFTAFWSAFSSSSSAGGRRIDQAGGTSERAARTQALLELAGGTIPLGDEAASGRAESSDSRNACADRTLSRPMRRTA